VNARRLYVPVVLALLALGGLALLGSTRTWLRATVETPGLPSDIVTVSGRDAVPATFGLALVVVAAALAILATGGWVRRGVGVLVDVVSVVGAAIALSAEPSGGPLRRALAESPAFTGADIPAATETAWQLATGVAFAGTAVLGLVVFALAGRWPTMGERYEAPALKRQIAEGDLWSALDEGRDPTE
jgi:uncharacterized membrane protein (TIGR02234 family)